VTEREWLTCADPWPMTEFLRGNSSDYNWTERKSFLFAFAVACWPESILLPGEKKKLADLLRHIAGNPFQPYGAPAEWPQTIVELAEALYDGQECYFALHDALLEAGYAELAEHFKQKDHPKGCWGLDLILGKT